MWWTNPWWLLALVLIIPLFFFSSFSLNHLKHTGPNLAGKRSTKHSGSLVKRLTILRAVAIIFVIFALSGTYILIPSRSRQLVILLDNSASIGEVHAESSRRAALQIIHSLKPGDQVALLTFAGQPSMITPWATPEEVAVILESAVLKPEFPDQTNIQAALQAAFLMFEGKSGNRSILLFSDGHSTTGGPVSKILTIIRNHGIVIDTVPVEIVSHGLSGRELLLPELVHPQEPVLAKWKLVAGHPQSVTILVKVDGKITGRIPFQVLSGENIIPLSLPPQNSGVHRVDVVAETVDGKEIPGSFSAGLLQVSGPARILIVHGDSTPALEQALANQGMRVEPLEFSRLPDRLEGLDSYGAIVLDNVPAFYMTENQQNMLQSYVAGGGGLLVIGGDTSLGRGGYYATGLEDILPVETDTRQRLLFPRANILFVIDSSGSMSETVGKTLKLAAMQGVAAAIKELNPQDKVGILNFDVEPAWVVRFTRVGRREEIMKSFSQIGEGGGTNPATVMEEVVREFSNPGSIRRHVIFLTDGSTDGGDFRELSQKLKSLRVTISAVVIGESVNERLLEDIARWGDGRYYRAKLGQIPRVIQKETVRITRDLTQEGFFEPVVRTYSPTLSGLEYLLPPVTGYLLTKPKNLATVYLEVSKGHPLLAGWRYGNGQVLVFAGDSGRRWLSAWSGNPMYNRFWSQLVRSIERTEKNNGLRAMVKAEATTARIVVEAAGPGNKLQSGLSLAGYTGSGPGQISFRLRETAPGRYEAHLPLAGPGIQQFHIHDLRNNSWTSGWVFNSPCAEYSALGPDLDFLSHLSDSTGGTLSKITENYLPRAKRAWVPLNLQGWLVVFALLVFLVELGYRSTLLGQFAMARTLFASWRAAMVRQAGLFRGGRGEAQETPGEDPKKNTQCLSHSGTVGEGTVEESRGRGRG